MPGAYGQVNNDSLSDDNEIEKQSIINGGVKEIKVIKKKKICFGICASILFVIMIAWLTIWIQWTDEARQNKEWLKKDIYTGDRRQLRIYPHRNVVRRKKCSDYKYGCCQIYYGCADKHDKIVSNSMTITPYLIVQHDEQGSNCPRLYDLISEYNSHYPEENDFKCANSEFGCCEINYSCDIRMRFDYRNKNFTKKLWLNDIKKNQTSKLITMAKRDLIGSNCPNSGEIVYLYERRWPSEFGGLWFLGFIGVIILIFISASNK